MLELNGEIIEFKKHKQITETNQTGVMLEWINAKHAINNNKLKNKDFSDAMNDNEFNISLFSGPGSYPLIWLIRY